MRKTAILLSLIMAVEMIFSVQSETVLAQEAVAVSEAEITVSENDAPVEAADQKVAMLTNKLIAEGSDGYQIAVILDVPKSVSDITAEKISFGTISVDGSSVKSVTDFTIPTNFATVYPEVFGERRGCFYRFGINVPGSVLDRYAGGLESSEKHTIDLSFTFSAGSSSFRVNGEVEDVAFVSEESFKLRDEGVRYKNDAAKIVPAGSKRELSVERFLFTDNGSVKINGLKLYNKENPADVIFEKTGLANGKSYNSEWYTDDMIYSEFKNSDGTASTMFVPSSITSGYPTIIPGDDLLVTVPGSTDPGIYSLCVQTSDGRYHYIENFADVTDKPYVESVCPTYGTYFAAEDEGEYISVLVYGFNLTSNAIPTFYSIDGTALTDGSIVEYEDYRTNRASSPETCGAVYKLRKTSDYDGAFEGAYGYVLASVEFKDAQGASLPTYASEDFSGHIFFRRNSGGVLRYECHNDELRHECRIYVAKSFAAAGEILSVCGKGITNADGTYDYSKEYCSEGVVTEGKDGLYVSFGPGTAVYDNSEGEYGFKSVEVYNASGEHEYAYVSFYSDPRVEYNQNIIRYARNLSVSDSCHWEIYTIDNYSEALFSGDTDEGSDGVLTDEMCTDISEIGTVRVCIYDDEGNMTLQYPMSLPERDPSGIEGERVERTQSTDEEKSVINVNLLKGTSIKIEELSKIRGDSSYSAEQSRESKRIAAISKKGVIKGIRSGEAQICVTSGGVNYEVNVSVQTAGFEKKSFCINRGSSIDTGFSFEKEPIKTVFSSTNENVLTVDASGVITAHRKGKAYVVADVDGKKIKSPVRVYDPVISGKNEIKKGRSAAFKVRGGRGKTVWSVEDSEYENTATVSPKGVLKINRDTYSTRVVLKAYNNGRVIRKEIVIK